MISNKPLNTLSLTFVLLLLIFPNFPCTKQEPNGKLKGVSGGERKRTSIAMSCVAYPKILFLDEPTSGLDSFIAFSVIKAMKRLCDKGVTVITTIHQPSSDTFSLFDDLMLISEGSIVYKGFANLSSKYFSEVAKFHCPPQSNPADYFFMHVLTCGDQEEAVR